MSFAPVLPTVDSTTNGTMVVVSGDFDDEMRGIGELADASAVHELIQGLADHGHRRLPPRHGIARLRLGPREAR